MPLIGLVVLLALTGCGDDTQPSDPCKDTAFIGSPDEPAEIEPGEISFDGTFTPLVEGSILTLFTPPQGGKIVLVGARIHNMDGCGAVLTARLRDPNVEGEPVAVFEGRTVRFVEIADRPGWGRVPTGGSEFSILAAGSNIPTCQNYENRDMDGCDWILHVSVEDRAGRKAEARFPVGLMCPEDDPGAESSNEQLECECECAASFETRDCSDLQAWEGVPPACEAALD